MIYDTQILKSQIPLDVLSHLREELYAMEPRDSFWRAPSSDYFYLSDELVEKLLEFIPLLPNETAVVMGVKNNVPTGLHTDANPYYADSFDMHSYARTFVIPLETLETSTILFDQLMPRGIQGTGKEMVRYIKQLPDINSITTEDINKYFKWLAQDFWINKLSIQETFSWVEGDIVTFDVYRIHTGDCHAPEIKKNFIFIWTYIN